MEQYGTVISRKYLMNVCNTINSLCGTYIPLYHQQYFVNRDFLLFYIGHQYAVGPIVCLQAAQRSPLFHFAYVGAKAFYFHVLQSMLGSSEPHLYKMRKLFPLAARLRHY
jgi:hypothetical protein